MNDSNKKTFAQKYSREFEKIVLEIVTDTLKKKFNIIKSNNTPEHKDGGYDGYCIIKSTNEDELTTLLETKLRTSCHDLPLSDFSKSIIIAINLDAACIVIGTNIYFTGNSVYQLKEFIYNTGLDIRTIDNKDILNWMNRNTDNCKKYNQFFIRRLRKYAETDFVNASRHLSLLENQNFDYCKEMDTEIYGRDRKEIREKIVSEIRKSSQTFVITGEKGIGKKTLINSVLFRLKNNINAERNQFFSINKIDVSQISSNKDFIYKIISALWCCNYSDTIDFLNNLANEENKKMISNLIPENIFRSLTALSDAGNNIDIDIFYSYVSSLYSQKTKKQRIRKILYFYNIEYSNNEILKNLITFIRKMSTSVSIILCLLNEQPNNTTIVGWNTFFRSVIECNGINQYTLTEWKNYDSNKFVKDHTTDKEISKYSNDVVDYFGNNPACIVAGIELIKRDKFILSQIKNGNFKLDRSFDVNKIKSTFLYVKSKMNEIQLRIQYLLLFINEKIEIRFLNEVLGIDENTLYREIIEMPFLKCDDFLYWENRFYADIFNENTYNYLIISEERLLLEKLILNVELLHFNFFKKNFVLLRAYMNLKERSKAKKISKMLIKNLNENKQYTDLYNLAYILIDSKQFDDDKVYGIQLRIEFLTSAMKMGLNGNDTDFISIYTELKDIIENNFIKNDNNQNINILLGRFCYISSFFHLTRSEYKEMNEDCLIGLKYLRYISNQSAMELKAELCANCAVSIKHLSNIEDCVSYLEKNEAVELEPEIRKVPKYEISYHLHHASLFTGNNPQKALDEFLSINEICQKYSKEDYLHNLHNISSMQFCLKHYNDAMINAQTVYKQAYEYNISVEFGRCQNVLGCLMWKDGKNNDAKNYFICSYSHFKNHLHNTHIWAPLVNLSTLCTEEKDEEACFYTKEAFKFMTENHMAQIKNARISDSNIPKIIVAVLMILRNLDILYRDSNEIQNFIDTISDERIQKIYYKYIKGKPMYKLFGNTSYNCDGIVMLKV